jgi:nitrous oxide reductase accessory protein NosL
MMAFYHEPHKYRATEAQRNLALAERILVRDYNARRRVDAAEATFVYKSRVKGPMGPDLIPFAKAEDGAAFAEANGGSVARFRELTVEMVRDLRK